MIFTKLFFLDYIIQLVYDARKIEIKGEYKLKLIWIESDIFYISCRE